MMPAHAAAAGYAPPRRWCWSCLFLYGFFSSDEHGMDVYYFARRTSGLRISTGRPRDLSRFVRNGSDGHVLDALVSARQKGSAG
jgi:hypothetical protein